MGAFNAVSSRGVSAIRVSAVVSGCMDHDVCADCLENVRWQKGHSRLMSALADDTITSMAVA